MNPVETKTKLAAINLNRLAMEMQMSPCAPMSTRFCDLTVWELAELLLELASLRNKVPMLRYTESLEIQLRQFRALYPDAKVGMAYPPIQAHPTKGGGVA